VGPYLWVEEVDAKTCFVCVCVGCRCGASGHLWMFWVGIGYMVCLSKVQCSTVPSFLGIC